MWTTSGRHRKVNRPASWYGITVVFLLLTATSPCSIGAPLGLPESTAKIGYGVGAGKISVDDPDGPTEDRWAARPFNLIYTDWLVRDIRQWTELYYFDTSLDAGVNNIGQNVESYGVRFSLQKNYRVTPSWSPWFGAGLDISNTRYSTRHTRDSGGFLIESFETREEIGVALLLNIMNEWTLQGNWTLGAKLEQSLPTDDGISEFTAAINVLYRY